MCLQKESPKQECLESMEIENSGIGIDSPKKLPILEQDSEHNDQEAWEEPNSEN